jgi:Zn-finger nucleic acid-binding protein
MIFCPICGNVMRIQFDAYMDREVIYCPRCDVCSAPSLDDVDGGDCYSKSSL